MNPTTLQTANWVVVGIGAVFAIVSLVVFFRILRRIVLKRRADDKGDGVDASSTANSQQFILATFQGVIQRQKAQEIELERLRRLEKERADYSQKINENISRNMPTGLMTINRHGIVTGSNPAAKEILHYTLLEGMHYSQILPNQKDFEEIFETCLLSGKRHHRVEMDVHLSDSQQKTLGISVSPIESAKEEITGVVCLISDLTELVALQKQVRMKEGLALLGEMAGGIAHEFKNSLATISGYAQMLEGESLPKEIELRLKMLRKEAAQLAGTVNRLLSFVKPQELNRNEMDLKFLLQELIEEIRMDNRFQNVFFGLEGKSLQYHGDESLLKSAFENLLLNAAEACFSKPDQGHVTCSLQDIVGDKSHRVLIKVSDDGCGIHDKDRERIFIPFFSTKSDGSGLGLAIVQKIILLHDGKIEVSSKTGQGTCFAVFL